MLTNKKGNYQRKYKQPFLKLEKQNGGRSEKKQDKNKKQNQISESAYAVHMFNYVNKNLKRQSISHANAYRQKNKIILQPSPPSSRLCCPD